MYPHINEISGPAVIGQKYRVPCVKHKTKHYGTYNDVPVIGTVHEDNYYFGVNWYHIHCDPRFIDGAYYDFIFNCAYISTDDERYGKTDDFIILSYAIPKEEILEKYERVLPCVRQMPVFPLHWSEDMTLPLQEKLQAGRRKLNKCGKCHHRGTPLNGMQVSKDGVVVCPAHGLAFNVKTREMVLRSKKEPLDDI